MKKQRGSFIYTQMHIKDINQIVSFSYSLMHQTHIRCIKEYEKDTIWFKLKEGLENMV